MNILSLSFSILVMHFNFLYRLSLDIIRNIDTNYLYDYKYHRVLNYLLRNDEYLCGYSKYGERSIRRKEFRVMNTIQSAAHSQWYHWIEETYIRDYSEMACLFENVRSLTTRLAQCPAPSPKIRFKIFRLAVVVHPLQLEMLFLPVIFIPSSATSPSFRLTSSRIAYRVWIPIDTKLPAMIVSF